MDFSLSAVFGIKAPDICFKRVISHMTPAAQLIGSQNLSAELSAIEPRWQHAACVLHSWANRHRNCHQDEWKC